MKLTVAFLALCLCVAFVSAQGPIARSLQRRIERIEAAIAALENRDRSLIGQARDSNRQRIKDLRDRLSKLRKSGEDTKDGDDDELFRFRRDADDEKKDEDKDDDKQEDGFITRRIKRLQEQVRNLEKQAATTTGKARELLFRQIDLQRAIIDRLLRRPVTPRSL